MTTVSLPQFNRRRHSMFQLIPETGLVGQYGTYVADRALVHAANTALGLEKPLLLTGEPGCGKSDFAWVAAKALGYAEPLRFHVRSDTRAKDLLYHYDALVRFGDAQHGDKGAARDPRNYVSLRPLGAALMNPGMRAVVLIDEIDKAPRDLPNDLLHEIDEGWFEIPEIGDFIGSQAIFDRRFKEIELKRDMKRPMGILKPLVVITSNAERQLPEPFLRRCVFFHIPAPTEEHLNKIIQARFGKEGDPPPVVLNDFAALFFALRENRSLVKKPTTAEMLDWVHAVAGLYDPREALQSIQYCAQLLRQKQPVPWKDLPGLGCLLKMAEDVEEIRQGAA